MKTCKKTGRLPGTLSGEHTCPVSVSAAGVPLWFWNYNFKEKNEVDRSSWLALNLQTFLRWKGWIFVVSLSIPLQMLTQEILFQHAWVVNHKFSNQNLDIFWKASQLNVWLLTGHWWGESVCFGKGVTPPWGFPASLPFWLTNFPICIELTGFSSSSSSSSPPHVSLLPFVCAAVCSATAPSYSQPPAAKKLLVFLRDFPHLLHVCVFFPPLTIHFPLQPLYFSLTYSYSDLVTFFPITPSCLLAHLAFFSLFFVLVWFFCFLFCRSPCHLFFLWTFPLQFIFFTFV